MTLETGRFESLEVSESTANKRRVIGAEFEDGRRLIVGKALADENVSLVRGADRLTGFFGVSQPIRPSNIIAITS